MDVSAVSSVGSSLLVVTLLVVPLKVVLKGMMRWLLQVPPEVSLEVPLVVAFFFFFLPPRQPR
ncbi:hypothetical protein F5Y18DRAFT_410207 [Xylariaceae sp. FL1019]|nr:hypothetical protein F5Y18DRAFT_410207 [Xylariaceae sp. FL1019]